MIRAGSCPDAQQWQRLQFGCLPEQEAATLEEHLEGCSICLETVRALVAEDDLVLTLRSQAEVAEPAEAEIVSRLVERLKDWLRPGSEGRVNETAPRPDPGRQPGPPAGQPTQELPTRKGGPLPEPQSPRRDDDRTLPLDPTAETAPAPPPCEDTVSFHEQGEGLSGDPANFCVPADLVDHPRYRVLEYLGSGGMGVVFKARHRLMDRLVALKVINRELVNRPIMVERFHREVKAAARLSHPNIVAAYDADQAGNTHFLVMEFVEGIDLDAVVREQGCLPIAQACEYTRQTALGLQHAWECGMVHRDIKPHNLMLAGDGHIKILDFGLARFVSEVAAGPTGGGAVESGQLSAQEGATIPAGGPRLIKGTSYSYTGAGTADYIAPEEAMDVRRADIRADIYSLGCTLYRFLAGRVPFPASTLVDKLQAHLEQMPEPLTALRADVGTRLAEVVARMMAKDPAARYQTPVQVAEALAPFAVSSPRSILVVDDDFATREALARTLEAEGYAVTRAGNGQEALDLLRSQPLPSLILLDLLMPILDGWQFLQQQKQDPALAGIPVVIISAMNQGQVRALALGAAGCLQKPLAVDEVTARVHDYVPPG